MHIHETRFRAFITHHTMRRGYWLLVWLMIVGLLAGVMKPAEPTVGAALAAPAVEQDAIPEGLSAPEWASVQEQIRAEQAHSAVTADDSNEHTLMDNLRHAPDGLRRRHAAY